MDTSAPQVCDTGVQEGREEGDRDGGLVFGDAGPQVGWTGRSDVRRLGEGGGAGEGAGQAAEPAASVDECLRMVHRVAGPDSGLYRVSVAVSCITFSGIALIKRFRGSILLIVN